jgi:hypothetical protein
MVRCHQELAWVGAPTMACVITLVASIGALGRKSRLCGRDLRDRPRLLTGDGGMARGQDQVP